MSSERKEHKKSLKGPDQFQVQVMSLMDHAVKQWKVIAAVLVPVALVVVGVWVYDGMQTRQKDGRLQELGKVQVVFDSEQRVAEDARTALQTQLEAVEAKLEKNKDDAAAKAEKEKLEKDMDAIKADHSGSLAQYVEYFKKFSGAPEGWMAGMTAARIHLENENVAEAKTVLEDVLSKSAESTFYQLHARLMLVGVLEELGDFDRALTELDTLDKQATPDLKPRVLLARGRIQYLKNAREEAKTTFATLIENHGASPEAQKARSMQALLN